MITLESRVAVSTDQVSVKLSEEAVILNTRSGVYFGLDDVALRIWQLLQNPVTVAELLTTIGEEYEIDAEKAAADLLRFLSELESEGLIHAESSEQSQ
jgi:hypothetical protein